MSADDPDRCELCGRKGIPNAPDPEEFVVACVRKAGSISFGAVMDEGVDAGIHKMKLLDAIHAANRHGKIQIGPEWQLTEYKPYSAR